MMVDWPAIEATVSRTTGQPCRLASNTPVGGGCINQCHRLQSQDGRSFFVKLNDVSLHPMLAAEAAGLAETR